MNITEHYLTLRFSFHQAADLGSVETTSGDLAGLLHCSSRNVHFIIGKMKELGWIGWSASRGRGKRGELTFLLPLAEAAKGYFESLLQQEKTEKAISFSKHPKLPREVQTILNESLQDRFGFQRSRSAPKNKDVLVVPHPFEVHTLDPGQASLVNEAHFIDQIFDPLVRYNPNTKRMEPHLVNGWKVSGNGCVWTFYLRKGVLFHHGKVLTAQDVKMTFERAKSGDSPIGWFHQEIRRIEIEDAGTVVFHLRRPNYLFIHYLGSMYSSILPSDLMDHDRLFSGTGPYKVQTFNKDMLILEAFDGYFKERAFIDQIEQWFVPRGTSLRNNYELQGRKNGPVKRIESTDTGSCFISFNFHKEGPHRNTHFRNALSSCIKRGEMVSALGRSRNAPSFSFLPERSKGVNDTAASVQDAKSFLAQSGYTGEPITMGIFDYPLYVEDADWIAGKAREAGIAVEIRRYSLSDIYNKRFLKDCDLFLAGEIFEDNIEWSYFILLKSASSMLRMFLDSETLHVVDRTVEELLGENDENRRMKQYGELEDYLRRKNAILFLYHSVNVEYYDDRIEGIEVNGYGYPNYRKLWLRE